MEVLRLIKDSHPNLYKLWVYALFTNPTPLLLDKLNRASADLHNTPDLTKFNIISLYCILCPSYNLNIT
uniref:Uncharacterized protein n=1 Tax=viral metagenome TaxID=1070528 RepID=A0A6C0BXA3_9ZZZZ